MILIFLIFRVDLGESIDMVGDALWAVRWVFVALAFIVLGALYAEALGLLRLSEEDNAQLRADLKASRAERERLAQLLWQQRGDNRRSRIVALQPRRDRQVH